MQKRFIELVTAFLDESGIECPVIPGENIVAYRWAIFPST